MASGYSVKRVLLDQPFSDLKLVEPGTRVRGVIVTQFDSGTILHIAFGAQGRFRIPAVGTIDVSDPEDAEMASEGVYLHNDTAQPGVSVEFVIPGVGR